MVTSLPKYFVPSQICEECVVSKQHQSKFFNKKSWRANNVLELMHSDLCEPINPLSEKICYYLH